MTPQVKQRIEQIRRGEVPEGYKKTKAGIMPLDWCSEKEYKAKNIFKSVTNKKHNGEFQVLSATQDKGVIPRSQVDIDIKFDESNVTGYKKVDCGDFVISLRSFQGGIEYSEFEGLVSPAYTVLKPIVPICDGYYKAYLKTVDYISRLNKGTYGIRDGKQVGFEDFGDMILHYPSLAEQEKIAEILSAQDKLIALKEKLIDEKKRQKKALMQHLLTGKKRLPGFNGEWKKQRMADILRERKEENKGQSLRICSVAVNSGVVDQCEHLGKSMAASDTSNYNVVHYGDIVYTKSPTGAFPYGIVKQSQLAENVAVSPLYGVYEPTSHEMGYLLNEYFMYSNNTNGYLLPIVNKGAKNTINISNSTFIRPSLYLPTDFKEIERLSQIFKTANREIEILQKELGQEKQKKKALMQLLLTGIVRTK